MYPLLKFLSAAATLLLSLASPLAIASNSLNSFTLAQAQTTPDQKAEAARLYQEGVELFRQRQLEQAAEKFQQVLAIEQKNYFSNIYLASIYEQLGQNDRAQEYSPPENIALEVNPERLTETERLIAEERAQIAQDIKNQAEQVYQRGIQQLRTEQLAQALQTFQQFLDINGELEEQSNDFGRRKALVHIASIYEQLGQDRQAQKYYEVVEIVLRRENLERLDFTALRDDDEDPKTRAERLFREGSQQLQNGLLPEALRNFEKVAAIHKQLGDRTGEGQAFLQIAQIYERQNRNNWAQQYYRRARERGVQ